MVRGIDDLIVGSIWSVLTGSFGSAEREQDLDLIARTRELLATSVPSDDARPAEDASRRHLIHAMLDGQGGALGLDSDWGLASLSAVGDWSKRAIADRNKTLYQELFSVAEVEHVQHSSPLVVIVVIAPAVGIAGSAWIASRAVRWIYQIRKERAGVRIAEATARIDRVRARMIEQAESDIQDDPELRQTVVDRVIDHLMPAAETLIDHPAVDQLEIVSESVG